MQKKITYSSPSQIKETKRPSTTPIALPNRPIHIHSPYQKPISQWQPLKVSPILHSPTLQVAAISPLQMTHSSPLQIKEIYWVVLSFLAFCSLIWCSTCYRSSLNCSIWNWNRRLFSCLKPLCLQCLRRNYAFSKFTERLSFFGLSANFILQPNSP